jgi:hypothetical protein
MDAVQWSETSSLARNRTLAVQHVAPSLYRLNYLGWLRSKGLQV